MTAGACERAAMTGIQGYLVAIMLDLWRPARGVFFRESISGIRRGRLIESELEDGEQRLYREYRRLGQSNGRVRANDARWPRNH
jgi:hypothetical protein